MGFSVKRSGYVHVGALISDVIADLLANGFVAKFPSGAWTTPAGIALDKFNVTLEAGGDVDPMNKDGVANKQPWRVKFDVLNDQTLGVYFGTPLQLADDGTHAKLNDYQGAPQDVLGAVGAPLGTGAVIKETEPGQGFINRKRRIGEEAHSYPLSYQLSVTDRGVFLGVWEDSYTASEGRFFSWFLVQRPVNRDTGVIANTLKMPVFCLNCVDNKYWRFTVREADVLRPSLRVAADVDTDDADAIINSKEQVALTEDNRYVVTCPSRLNTARYRYTDELDMIGTTSADVISQDLQIPVPMYGEAKSRIYTALHANGLNNTGMRLMVLTKGGGALALE